MIIIKEKKERPWMKTGENRNCLICNIQFYVPKNGIISNRGKYCSRKCYEISKRGKPMHPNTKKALLGNIPWNKGLKVCDDERVKRFVDAGHKALKPEPWNKGLKYGKANWIRYINLNLYRNIHKKAVRLFGKPMECEDCKNNTLKRYHWANINGEYLLNREDWKRLCPKCHAKLDMNNQKGMKLYESAQIIL